MLVDTNYVISRAHKIKCYLNRVVVASMREAKKYIKCYFDSLSHLKKPIAVWMRPVKKVAVKTN